MIFVSAGHYPSAPGATFERFIEHDEAAVWASALDEKLGTDSILVPATVLKEKTKFINARLVNGDVALEIHFNAAVDADGKNVGRGCETLYYPESEKGLELAEICQKVLAENFPPDRGTKEGWYKMDKSRGADFFLAKTGCPAVILEPEFVHRNDLISANRDNTIDGLATALKEYTDGEGS